VPDARRSSPRIGRGKNAQSHPASGYQRQGCVVGARRMPDDAGAVTSGAADAAPLVSNIAGGLWIVTRTEAF